MEELYLKLNVKTVERDLNFLDETHESETLETSEIILDILRNLKDGNVIGQERTILIEKLAFFRKKLISQADKIKDSGKRFYYHNIVVACDEFIPESEKYLN